MFLYVLLSVNLDDPQQYMTVPITLSLGEQYWNCLSKIIFGYLKDIYIYQLYFIPSVVSKV